MESDDEGIVYLEETSSRTRKSPRTGKKDEKIENGVTGPRGTLSRPQGRHDGVKGRG